MTLGCRRVSVTLRGTKRKMDEEREDFGKIVLEFMNGAKEAKAMFRKVEGWSATIARGCLGGIGELVAGNLDVRLEAFRCSSLSLFLFCIRTNTHPDALQPAEDPTDNIRHLPRIYEQSLDRLACALGRR
jgi:importin-5